ncbi:MAG: hypothetical protein OK449_01675 [Thaumarchaeota archaeon]|nr:hypothetical protein [Nitrososphaerota archaeon]
MVLRSLREVLDSDYRGPRAVFTQVDVLKALVAIGKSGKVGRGRLGTLTGLGQGEVRTLIKRLKDNQLIVIEVDGCRLSKKGEKEYAKISSLLLWSGPVNAKPLELGERCWAVLVAGVDKGVRYGIEQRDAAIKAGADGAFTSVFKSGRFTVPGEGADCEKDGPSEPWVSLRKVGPHEGDVVVVTGSSKEADAENGALAAVLTLA